MKRKWLTPWLVGVVLLATLPFPTSGISQAAPATPSPRPRATRAELPPHTPPPVVPRPTPAIKRTAPPPVLTPRPGVPTTAPGTTPAGYPGAVYPQPHPSPTPAPKPSARCGGTALYFATARCGGTGSHTNPQYGSSGPSNTLVETIVGVGAASAILYEALQPRTTRPLSSSSTPSGPPEYAVAFTGTVSDSSGRPIPGAIVELRGVSNLQNASRVAQASPPPKYTAAYAYVESDVDGRYAIAALLKSGTYALIASSKTTGIQAVTQTVAQTAKVVQNFTLPQLRRDAPLVDYASRAVYYVTDRAEATSRSFGYSTQPSQPDTVRKGRCWVAVAWNDQHNANRSSYRFTRRPDVRGHAILDSTETPFAKDDDFFESLNNALLQTKSKSVVVFIHGYNQTFEQGAEAAGQLRYDSLFNGPMILYSWPSAGKLLGYSSDENQIKRTSTDFAIFIEELSRRLMPGIGIDIVAHSMGNRDVTDLLEGSSPAEGGTTVSLKQVVMAAPDVDSAQFKSHLQSIQPTTGHITIYASRVDQALVASAILHNGMRLGLFLQHPAIVRGMDTVDASSVDTSLIGHSYYLDSSIVAGDIQGVLQGRTTNQRDHLSAVVVKQPFEYWLLSQP